jgi:hypothetical protein
MPPTVAAASTGELGNSQSGRPISSSDQNASQRASFSATSGSSVMDRTASVTAVPPMG